MAVIYVCADAYPDGHDAHAAGGDQYDDRLSRGVVGTIDGGDNDCYNSCGYFVCLFPKIFNCGDDDGRGERLTIGVAIESSTNIKIFCKWRKKIEKHTKNNGSDVVYCFADGLPRNGL